MPKGWIVSRALARSKARLTQGGFLLNVLTLITGTTVAQAIPILVSPILTRIYSPGEFGCFALYMSVGAVLSIFTTGRYEMAIMLPEKEEDAASLLMCCFMISCITSILSFVIIYSYNPWIGRILGNEEIGKWLYLLPVSLLFAGAHQGLNYWAIRQKHFGLLARRKVLRAACTSGTNVGVGIGCAGPGGLIFGDLVGTCIASGVLGWQAWRDNEALRNSRWSWSRNARKLMKEYKSFPFYSIPADLINIVSNQIPLILFSNFFGASMVGYYALTQRVLSAPVNLIGSSVLDVFRQKASSDYIKTGSCKEIYIKTFKFLALASILPFFIFLTTSPFIFSFIFGEEWRHAGIFAQILAIKTFLGFIASPLGNIFYIVQKQNYELLWQACLLILSVGSIMLGVHYNNVELSLLCFSLTYSGMYIIYLFWHTVLSRAAPSAQGCRLSQDRFRLSRRMPIIP